MGTLKELPYECPGCKSKLVLREGPFGKFVGCSAFPKCKFSFSVQMSDSNLAAHERSSSGDREISSAAKDFLDSCPGVVDNVVAKHFAREMAMAGDSLCRDLVALEGRAGPGAIDRVDYFGNPDEDSLDCW